MSGPAIIGDTAVSRPEGSGCPGLHGAAAAEGGLRARRPHAHGGEALARAGGMP